MTAVLLTFCEAVADLRTTARIVDRLSEDRGPAWLRDNLGDCPQHVRSWRGEVWPAHDDEQAAPGEGQFIAWTHVDKLMSRLRLPRLHGHFRGEPGLEDAVAGRNALQIASAFRKAGQDVDGVLLVRDADDKPERRKGLRQAREEAADRVYSFPIAIGVADPKREAWVLAAFIPADDEERERLESCKRELGFDPCADAHELQAKQETAKRSAKRVLEFLTCGSDGREEDAWKRTSIGDLERRGIRSGLKDFIDEVEEKLLPVLA